MLRSGREPSGLRVWALREARPLAAILTARRTANENRATRIATAGLAARHRTRLDRWEACARRRFGLHVGRTRFDFGWFRVTGDVDQTRPAAASNCEEEDNRPRAAAHHAPTMAGGAIIRRWPFSSACPGQGRVKRAAPESVLATPRFLSRRCRSRTHGEGIPTGARPVRRHVPRPRCPYGRVDSERPRAQASVLWSAQARNPCLDSGFLQIAASVMQVWLNVAAQALARKPADSSSPTPRLDAVA